MTNLAWPRLMTTALLRIWITFSASAFIWAVVFAYMDGDSPLRSDDPYIVGFIFGIVAAAASVLYSLGDAIVKRTGVRALRDTIYYVVVISLFFGAWWFLSRDSPEGEDIITYISVGGILTCVAIWPLCRFRIPVPLIAAITICGILFVIFGSAVSLLR